jgi:hypothetical protein
MNIYTPSINFISKVEGLFSVLYPESFKIFCREYESKNILLTYPSIGEGQFIKDLDTLKKINSRIGAEEWGDYESAIAGKLHPKDGMKLWGGLLPIYFDDGNIFGFDFKNRSSEKIFVWSIHCIVYSYPNLESWLKTYYDMILAKE